MTINKKYGIFNVFFICIRYASAPSIFILLFTLICGFIPSVKVIAEASFINNSILVLQDKQPVDTAVFSILVVTGFLALEQILQMASKYLRTIQLSKIRLNICPEVFDRISRLPLSEIESPSTQNLLERVTTDVEAHFCNTFQNIILFMSQIVTVMTLLFLLFTQIKWSALIIVVVAAFLFKIAQKSGQAVYHVNRETSEAERRTNYLQNVLTGKEFAEERILFCFFNKLNKQWLENSEQVRKQKQKATRKWLIHMKSSSIILIIILLFIMASILPSVISGLVTVGFFISFTNAALNMTNLLSWSLTDVTQSLAEEKEYMNDYSDFLALPQEHIFSNTELQKKYTVNTIEFRNVSFTYPNQKKKILNHLSFRLEGNNHFAIVGSNGSGKTTMIKLLTGFYDNYEGDILINGTELRNFDKSEIKQLFFVVSQNYAKYQVSFEDNIALGNIGDFENTKQKIPKIIKEMKLENLYHNLPNEEKTLIGSIYEGGIDLSGGEWQKLSVSRVLTNNRPVVILDEPTASLDPIIESEMFKDFGTAVQNRISILISHRLGSVKNAQQILVLDDGCLVAMGNHNELYGQCKLYQEMFDKQKSWYEK